jgi:hypothetical protein
MGTRPVLVAAPSPTSTPSGAFGGDGRAAAVQGAG